MRTPFCIVIVTSVVIGYALPAMAQVDQQRAQEYFKEAQALCERDNGRLWGVSICAPMVIGDARTQTFATSQTPPDAPRPQPIGLVNGPVQWGGTMWAAVTWDTIANWPPRTRGEVFLHEAFHIVQPALILNGPTGTNDHLDSVDGRYWLRLEWRALARALRESGDARAQAVRDALAFREARHTRYSDKVESERALYITEGLASYTQTVLAAPSEADAIARALELLAAELDGDSFVRTFTYTSGPAYGLLLDAASPGWPRTIRGSDDPVLLLMRALVVQPAADAAAAAARYGGAALRTAEEQREQQRQTRIAELRQRFVDDPVFVMPGGGGGTSNSMGAAVIPDAGTVYFHPYRMSGPWGVLEAESGVLVATDGRSRRLPAPVRGDDGTISGDGWTFTAAAGWMIREGARPGDYEVVQRPADASIQLEGDTARLDRQILESLEGFGSNDQRARIAAFYALLDASMDGGYQGRTSLIGHALAECFRRLPAREDQLRVGLIDLLARETGELQAAARITEEANTYWGDLAAAVVSLRDRRAIDVLLSLIARGNNAISGLAELGDDALEPVVSKKNDTDEFVRLGVARTLSLMAGARPEGPVTSPHSQTLIEATLIDLARDTSPFVRIATLDGLARLRTPLTVAVLRELADRDPYYSPDEGLSGTRVYPVRLRAAAALAAVSSGAP